MRLRYLFVFFCFLYAIVHPSLLHATIVINEVLPKTQISSFQFIELYNNGSERVSLDRWKLELNSGEIKTYTMNASSIIEPHNFLTFCQTQTGFIFNTGGETMRLIDEKNSTIDTQSYPGILGYNTAMGRSSDGGGYWTICTVDTPNKSNNCPAPTITPIIPTAIPPTSTPIPPPLDTPYFSPSPTLIPSTPTQEPEQIVASPSPTIQTQTLNKIAILGILISTLWISLLIVYYVYKKKNIH